MPPYPFIPAVIAKERSDCGNLPNIICHCERSVAISPISYVIAKERSNLSTNKMILSARTYPRRPPASPPHVIAKEPSDTCAALRFLQCR